MIRKTLGRTGLEVTQLGFGSMELRGERIWSGRPVHDEQAERLLNEVLDAGINFIDTANCYGKSEGYIGRFISSRRNEYYLATKCGCGIEDAGDHDETPHEWTRERLERNLDESLALMKTDHVDIWQIHNADPALVEAGGLVDVMKAAQADGRVRFLGVSTTLPHLPKYLAMGVFDTFQIPYSALQRAEEDTITAAASAGAGIIIRGGVTRGALSEDRKWEERAEIWDRAGLDDLLGGMSRMEFLLRFTLTHPFCHTTIVGTLNPAHLRGNLAAAAAGPLPADTYTEAKRRLDDAGEKPEPLPA